MADRLIRATRWALPYQAEAVELPWTPGFLHKNDGLILSMGQFMQWVGAQVQSSGTVHVWPGTPVAQALVEDRRVVGLRLLDQGTDRKGNPEAGFMPGMDIRAALTVVGDGPVGPIGRQLDEQFGLPQGHEQHEWAVGMKMVVDLREGVDLKPGTVLHTFGFPEPEIFGFLYVHPDRVVSVGIFVPSWFDSPVAYRLPLPPALDAPSLPVAPLAGRPPPLLGRQNAWGVWTPGRTPLGRRWLRAHWRRLRKHQCPHRIGCR